MKMININTPIEYLTYGEHVFNNAADIETKVKAVKILDEACRKITEAIIAEDGGMEMLLTTIRDNIKGDI
jgi:hypothetical protein